MQFPYALSYRADHSVQAELVVYMKVISSFVWSFSGASRTMHEHWPHSNDTAVIFVLV